MSEPQGRILPAGSPLVQFEIERNCPGSNLRILPVTVWVNRHPLKKIPSDKCKCGQLDFEVAKPFPRQWRKVPGVHVCGCMGRFVE